MNNSLQNIYESHHFKNRPQDFSILEKERSELLREYIGKGKKVLDIGCRDGTLTRHFIDGNSVLGVDIDDNLLKKAESNLHIKTLHIDLNGDWRELNNEKFDVIVAGEILEHLYYPERIIEKVVKHLNPGGKFIGSVPNAFSLKNRLRYLAGTKKYTPLSDPTHINHFSYLELRNLLKKYFKNVEIIGLGKYAKLSKKYPSLISFDLFWISK